MCTTWYDQSGLSSLSWWIWENWLFFYFKMILPMTLVSTFRSLLLNADFTFSVFSFMFPFTFSAILIFLPYPLTPYSCLHPLKLSPSPTSSLSLDNSVELSNENTIQFLHPSLSHIVVREISFQLLDLCFVQLSIVLDFSGNGWKPLSFNTRGSPERLQRAFGVHRQAIVRLQRWNDDPFQIVWCQPSGGMMDYLLATEDVRKVLNDCSNLTVLNGQSIQAAVDILHKTCEHRWAVSHLHITRLSSQAEKKPMLAILRSSRLVKFSTRPLPWCVATKLSCTTWKCRSTMLDQSTLRTWSSSSIGAKWYCRRYYVVQTTTNRDARDLRAIYMSWQFLYKQQSLAPSAQ